MSITSQLADLATSVNNTVNSIIPVTPNVVVASNAIVLGGNVGIGTGSPVYTLDTWGNVRITGSGLIGNITITNINVSTSTGTGVLVVRGGAGIAGNLYVGGNISVSNTTQATSALTGALVVAGGAGITGNAFISNAVWAGNIAITNTTTSTSSTTGALVVAGGAGITSNLFVGGSINGSNVNVTGSSAPPNGIWLAAANSLGFSSNSTERMRIDSVGNVGIGTAAISSGNIMSIYGGNVFVAGNIQLGRTATAIGGIQFSDGTFQATAALPPTTASTMSIANQTDSAIYYPVFVAGTGPQSEYINTTSLQLVPNSGNIITIGSVYAGNVGITNTTAATSSTTGALVVAGGMGIGGNIIVGASGNIGIGTSIAASPLHVMGTALFAGSVNRFATQITNMVEPVTIIPGAPAGNINIAISNQSIVFHTTAATGNFNANVTFSNTATLNSVMSVGQAVTVSMLATQGTTAYFSNAIIIDGTRGGITTYWQGNTAPTAGTVSAVDVYTYTIIKTGSAAYTVLAAQSKY